MTDYATIASLATAGGTFALAGVTLAVVRSSNRAARIAEHTMLAGMRPLLLASRLQDVEQKVGFADQHWVHLPGGRGTAEVTAEVVYLTGSIRNAGTGLAVMHGWSLVRYTDDAMPISEPEPPERFRRLTRDLYVAGGDVGFWQGAIRDADDPDGDYLRDLVARRQRVVFDVLYGDHDGGQRTISRFSLLPGSEDGTWLLSVARHWYLDRASPRA